VPSYAPLDALTTDPRLIAGLSDEDLTTVLGRLAVLHHALMAEVARRVAPAAFVEEPTPDADAMLTVPDVAARLKLPKAYVYDLIRRGDLPAVKIGASARYRRVRAGDLGRWLAAGRTAGPGQPYPAGIGYSHDRPRPPAASTAARTLPARPRRADLDAPEQRGAHGAGRVADLGSRRAARPPARRARPAPGAAETGSTTPKP
jgi:excisionase family DNA binding protein